MSCSLHVNVCLSDGDDDDFSLDEEDVVFDFCRVKKMEFLLVTIVSWVSRLK